MRKEEAEALGARGASRDDWYDIITPDGRTIKVFPLQPKERAIYPRNTPADDGTFFIPIDRSPPI